MAAGAFQAWLPRDQAVYEGGTIEVPESANLTALRGTPGVWDVNGRAAPCTTSPAAIGFIFAGTGSNSGAGTNNVLVWPVRVHQQWKVYLLDALALTQIGNTLLGAVQDTVTKFWYLSTADTGAQAKIIDYESGPAGMNIGDTKAPVYVEFVYAKIQYT